MATLPEFPKMGGVRTPSIRAAFTVSIWRGIPTLKGRKGKKYVTKALGPLRTQNLFREAADAAKRITPQEKKFAIDTTKASQYLWRDIYYMALYGRLFTFVEQGEGRWVSVAARNTMSESLDALGSQKSGLLMRGTTWWDILEPGPEGYQLVSHGPFLPLAWEPRQGGGGGLSMSTLDIETLSTTATASMGMVFNPAVEVAVEAASMIAGWISGATYVASLVKISGGVITEIVAQSAPQNATSAFNGPLWFQFPAPFIFAAGEQFGLVLTRTSSAGTVSARLWYSDFTIQSIPVTGRPQAFRLAQNALVVGQAVTNVADINYAALPAYRA